MKGFSTPFCVLQAPHYWCNYADAQNYCSCWSLADLPLAFVIIGPVVAGLRVWNILRYSLPNLLRFSLLNTAVISEAAREQ